MANGITLRQSIESLERNAGQLDALRDAYAKMQRLSATDNRSWTYWAGIHGFPQFQCWHHGRVGMGTQRPYDLFLPWHRAYLLYFEHAARDQNDAAAVPWWDWTSTGSRQVGVPESFSVEEIGVGGVVAPRGTLHASLITMTKGMRESQMPKVEANGISMNYDSQGAGEPLVLIPYLAADYACYAFQVAEYSKHFTCISVDPRGAGESDKPEGTYSTELFADDVAAFMQALGIPRAHVAGLSLGAATGMWLAAKYPHKVMSLSLHSAWARTDPFLRVVVEGWQVMARGLGNVTDMIIKGIFPWCFTPELYAARPEYVNSLAEFVRGRPAQPLDAFFRQSNAVLAHDAESQLSKIKAPTQITFGRYDMVASTRFADRMKNGIKGSELIVFEGCAHAPIYEKVDEFNQKTLGFLRRHTG